MDLKKMKVLFKFKKITKQNIMIHQDRIVSLI